MFTKNGKVLSFSLAALLQTGALSAAEPVNVLEPVSASGTKESETLNVSSSQLGLEGPIEFSTSYNEDLGVIFGANFATYINAMNALAFEIEGGENMYRLNGTWGFAINERNRIKFSIERLADNDDYDFASGTESEWIGQNAIGGSYQYILDAGWLQAIDLNAYGAKADSKNYNAVVFFDKAGNPLVNQRRITGGETAGASVGLTLLPTQRTRAEIALHYDAVNYDIKYDEDDPSTSGLGFSADIEHLLSERIKAKIGADVLSTDHTYEAGITWLAPSKIGSSLEFSVLGSYLDSQTTSDQAYQVGVQAIYGWDEGSSQQNTGYSSFTALALQDLKTWARDPAVRMPEVMAVVDEAVFAAVPKLIGDIPDVTTPELTPIDFTVAPYFKSDGENQSTLTYTATGLPQGIKMNTNGRLVGTTPDEEQTKVYPVDVIATNSWGFSQPDSFNLKVEVEVLAPIALPIPPKSYEEGATGQVDLSQFFKDPNVPEDKTPRKAKAQADSGLTYTLISKPAGWDTPLTINETTGVISGVVPFYKADGNNTYEFVVTAANAGGFVENPVKVTVIDINRVIAEPIPQQSFVEDQRVDGLLDLNNYFHSENNTTLSYKATGLEKTGLSVTPTGQLVGVAAPVSETTTYTAAVIATNTEGAQATNPLVVVIEAFAGNIVLEEAIPAQTTVEKDILDANNSINLNDYFTNDQDGAIAYNSDDLSNLGSVSINDNGVIVGTVKEVDSNTVTSVAIEAYNPDDSNITPVNTQIEYTLLAIPSSEAIPAQSANERSVFSLDVNASGTGNFQPATPGDLTYSLSGAPTGWTVNNEGVINGTVPVFNAANNVYTVKVTAVNSLDNSLTTTQSFEFTVLDISSEITVGSVPTQNVPEGYDYTSGTTAINLNEVFTDTDGNELVFSDNGQLANIGLRIDANGMIVGEVTVDANTQNLTIPIVAAEKDDSSVSATVDIVFNIAAQVSSEQLTNQTAVDNTDYSYNAAVEGNFQPYNASNPQADQNLVFSMTGAPSTMSIDTVTGLISGKAAYVPGSNNVYNITVTATNIMDEQLKSSQPFQLTVKAGTISITAAPQAQKAPEGTTYTAGTNAIDLNQVFKDSAGREMVFTDDGKLADIGLSINANGFIVGTLKAEANVFDLPVNITAKEKDNSAVTATVAVRYTIAAEVSSSTISDQEIEANSTSVPYNFDAAKAGNFQPMPNPNTDLTFTLAGAPTGLKIDSKTGVISGNIPYSPSGSADYTITVKAENTLNKETGATFSTDESYKLKLSAGVGFQLVTSQPFPDQVKIRTGTVGFEYNAAQMGQFQPFNYQDPNNNTLVFKMSGNPSYLVIDSKTGVIKQTPPPVNDPSIDFPDYYRTYYIKVWAEQAADTSLRSEETLTFTTIVE